MATLTAVRDKSATIHSQTLCSIAIQVAFLCAGVAKIDLKFINYDHFFLQQIEMLRLQRVERFARWMAANGAL